MPGRPCQICADPAKLKVVAEMIAAGGTDQAIAQRIGGVNRMSVARHRTNHVVAPARALVEAAAKGQDVRERRAEVLAAAEAGDPLAFVALAQIVNDLRRVHARLERVADAAELDDQKLAVASLSSAQLRAAEVRAKIGAVGAYAPPRGEKSSAAPFVLTICFSGREPQRIEGVPLSPDEFNAIPAEPLPIGSGSGAASAPGADDEGDGDEVDEDV